MMDKLNECIFSLKMMTFLKNTIWDKISADIKTQLDCEPVYNNEFLKTEIKSHCDKVTDFYDNKIPKSYLFSSN